MEERVVGVEGEHGVGRRGELRGLRRREKGEGRKGKLVDEGEGAKRFDNIIEHIK